MKVLVTVFAICIFMTATGFAQTGGLPQLIDRELFFDTPEYSGAQISPDGKYISFRKPFKGTMNIWVKGTNEAFEKARPLTNRTDRPIAQYFWSRDSKYILFIQDNGGDENFNVYAVSPADSHANGAEVPAARNITAAKGATATIQAVPQSDPNSIYVGLNERDKAWFDLFKVNISTGERTQVVQNTDRLGGFVFDNADKLRLAVCNPPSGDTEILLLDGDKPKEIYSCGIFETCSPVGFSKDNKQVYLMTNKGSADLIGLELLDIATGAVTKVEGDPLGKVDMENAIFSDRTHELVATVYNDEKRRIYWKDKNRKADDDLIKKRLGNREFDFLSSTADESKWIVISSSDIDPGTAWLYDRKTKNLKTLYQVREKLPRKALAEMKPIKYPSSDGLMIPAYLTLPKGVEAKALPLIVFPHGGPWARDTWGYRTYAQFLANRGYAVLSPNFRGSTGYGKKFLDAGNLEWGRKMQDDLTWGVKHLVGQGIVDPKRVGIMGGSYGGYATLAGVAFTPDLYSAAVAIVAPSNLSTLLESIPPYWEAARVIFYKRMGDPTTAAGKELLKERSPLTYVDRIKTPLMIVQGANDPRVNKRESDQIVIALRDRGFPVEYILAPDEGHGFQRPVNNMAMLAAAEKFLANRLGGRFQESATPEVAKRLSEITVDPKTVVITYKKEAYVKGTAANISGKWDMKADTGSQMVDVALDLTQTGEVVNGSLASPYGGGTISDGKVTGNKFVAVAAVEINGQSLLLKIEGVIDGSKMTGTMSGPGVPNIDFTAVKQK